MTDSVQSTFSVNAAYGSSEYGLVQEGYGPPVSESLTAAEAIPFGRVVVWDVSGAADDKAACRLPSTTGEVTTAAFGISAKDQTRKHGDGYAVGSSVRVLRKGRIRVQVEETVVRGDVPFVRFASGGGGSVLGIFRNDADTASCVALPGAVFAEGGTTATGAILEVNLPQGTLVY